MNKDIKPIETIYKGFRFRSRLEARWAVFFDTLGIEYNYEEEGFSRNGLKYLPDFKIKCHGTRGQCNDETFDLYVEVKKKDMLSEYEARKIKMFSHGRDIIDTNETIGEIDLPLLIVTEIPNIQSEYDCIDTMLFGSYESLGYEVYPFNMASIDGDYFGAFPSADSQGRFYLMADDSSYLVREDCPRVIKAYQKARHARFEYGDKYD